LVNAAAEEKIYI